MGSDSTVVVTDNVDLDGLAAVYRKVHAADLHLIDHGDPSVEDRLRWTAEAPGFLAAVGYVGDELAATVMGCPLPPETLWWRDLAVPAGRPAQSSPTGRPAQSSPAERPAEPDVTAEWAGRTFAVSEAFVLPEHRRHRLGLRMFTALLAERPEERVSLAVTETNARVWGALRAVRFRHVGNLVPFPGWRSHRMLVRDLPIR